MKKQGALLFNDAHYSQISISMLSIMNVSIECSVSALSKQVMQYHLICWQHLQYTKQALVNVIKG